MTGRAVTGSAVNDAAVNDAAVNDAAVNDAAEGNPETILMVTPYAPYRDGIAAYAVQEVRRMRADGLAVEVLSPLPSAAQHHLSLGGVRGIAALTKRARNYDRVIIQFSPEMIFGACWNPAQRVGVWVGLGALAKVTKLEIRLHEIEYGPLARNPAERLAAAQALKAAAVVSVHTSREIDELASRVGLSLSNLSLVDHGSSFAPATAVERSEARAELGLDGEEHVFLAIGFLQEHKGFDLAVEAFGRAGLSAHASMHIVGSVRVDHPDLVAYARRLRSLCHAVPGASLHERYVSDEEFDRWIVAADTIVLPYREIWSSGVLERAKLFGRSIIAADVGGMADQAPEGARFFTDLETLVQALKEQAQLGSNQAAADIAVVESGDPVGLSSEGHPDGYQAGLIAELWDVDRKRPDRRSVEAQIREAARALQLDDTRRRSARVVGAAAVDPLLAIGALKRPGIDSARPGVTHLKRVLRRLLHWEIEPIAEQVEALQQATIEAVTELESRIKADRRSDGVDR